MTIASLTHMNHMNSETLVLDPKKMATWLGVTTKLTAPKKPLKTKKTNGTSKKPSKHQLAEKTFWVEGNTSKT